MKFSHSAKALICSVKPKLEGCQQQSESSLVKSHRKDRATEISWQREKGNSLRSTIETKTQQKLKCLLLPFVFIKLYFWIDLEINVLSCSIYFNESQLYGSELSYIHFITHKFFTKLPLHYKYFQAALFLLFLFVYYATLVSFFGVYFLAGWYNVLLEDYFANIICIQDMQPRKSNHGYKMFQNKKN